jgi:hypothetical protein
MSALLSVCWAPRGGSTESLCPGPVAWARDDAGVWHSNCSKCGASGRAAVGERVALDAMTPGLGGVA